LLNLYYHDRLDGLWRERHADLPLIRWADDLLVLCRTVEEARQAHRSLAEILQAAGTPLKSDHDETPIRTLTPKHPAKWLGYSITKRDSYLRFRLRGKNWAQLGISLAKAQKAPNSPLVADSIVNSWLSQAGPAYRHTPLAPAITKLVEIARAKGFDELPSNEVIRRWWQRSHARWGKDKKLAMKELSPVSPG